MADTLQQIRWKLWRARTNTEEINSACNAFLQSSFYAVDGEMDNDGGVTLRFGRVDPMPPMLSILVGETAYHLRSALDHLMFKIARPAPGEERYVQFPIARSGKEFRSMKGGMRGVPPGVSDIVESVQPYHGGRGSDAWRLLQLRIVNNWDKHRTPMIAAASFDASSASLTITKAADGTGGIINEEKFRGRVEHGTVIAKFQIGGYWNVGDKIEPNTNLVLQPVYDLGMPEDVAGEPILAVLGGAGSFIEREILPRLETFL